MKIFFLFVCLIAFTYSINDNDVNIINEYLKFQVNDSRNSVFTNVEKDQYGIKYNLKSKSSLLKDNPLIRLNIDNIYSSITFYPFYNKVFQGLKAFFGLDIHPNLISTHQFRFPFFASQLAYQLLFLKYSKNYFKEMKNSQDDDLDTLNDLYGKNNYNFNSKLKEASIDDLDFVNFAISYGETLPSLIGMENGSAEDNLAMSLNLKSDKYLYLTEIHSNMQLFMGNMYPESKYDVFINNDTYKEFINIMKYLFNEGILNISEALGKLLPYESIELLRIYLDKIHKNDILGQGFLYTTASYTSLKKIPFYFNFLSNFDDQAMSGFSTNVIQFVSSGLLPSNTHIEIFNGEIITIEEIVYYWNDSIIENQYLDYFNQMTQFEVENKIEELMGHLNYRKYISHLPKEYTNQEGRFFLNNKSINTMMLSLLRMGNIPDINDITFTFQTYKKAKINNYSEILACLKYKDILDTFVQANLLAVISNLIIITKALDKEKQLKHINYDRIKKLISLKNILGITYLKNTVFTHQSKLIYEEMNKDSLKNTILLLKKEIIN